MSDDSAELQTSDSDDASSPGGASPQSGTVAAPDPDYVNLVLTGAVALAKVSEAAAILVSAEAVAGAVEPAGAILEVVHMALAVWDALETPDRTCGYQGLVYGLMYTALDMGAPLPNPTWPSMNDAPQHDQRFAEGLARATDCLSVGQIGVRRKNLILLDVARLGEKAVINDLWQHAISDDDRLLKMFTIEWPNVGPNG